MSLDLADEALNTLFQPLAEGLLDWPTEGGVLFLRARTGHALQQSSHLGLICEQEFKPSADALTNAGLTTVELDSLEPSRRFALVLVLPPRQREEARALLAQAVARCAPGGRVLASMRNDEGARTGEDDLALLAGGISNLSRRKCRAFWTAALQGPADLELADKWAKLDAPRAILDGRFISRPGVFAWDRIDPASELLAAHLPKNLAGHAADLGAGYGYLSTELLTRCPQITTIDLYEAQSRALAMARENLRDARVPCEFSWHDVTAGLSRHYDVIVSNPPFHAQSREDRPDLGRRFISVAAQSLNANGSFWMVANRHLAYEYTLNECFAEIRSVAQKGGFKVIEARGPRQQA
ncbi:class I SAM-dependent methyltransferase [Stenotrophobium rhamnosiphilum]|uniref:16S rRNA methyltransferase n=1 Tax=Stenotrophobium rhamnosiphilum TaxID=2029166 RepID=A0A2T5MBH8_9GAMM|nr:class I SAM-dependent methyltransferase [Stenotrophobium rhamnosiphilum]PTU29076.1 16S rRNA methyltransferase [Stenotrophobium rhamnosiphilum]